MFDITGGQVLVIASLTAVLLGRHEMKTAAFYLGKFTGNTVGMLRRYRSKLQQVVQEADMPVESMQADLQRSMAEVHSIREELAALTNFSPQMMQHGKFDLSHEELDNPRHFSPTSHLDASAEQANRDPSDVTFHPASQQQPGHAGAMAATATDTAGGDARQPPAPATGAVDPLDAILSSAYGAPSSGSSTEHIPRGAAPTPVPDATKVDSTRVVKGTPAGSASQAAHSAGPASWAADPHYSNPMQHMSEYTARTDRIPGGADLVLQAMSDHMLLQEFARQAAKEAPPSDPESK